MVLCRLTAIALIWWSETRRTRKSREGYRAWLEDEADAFGVEVYDEDTDDEISVRLCEARAHRMRRLDA